MSETIRVLIADDHSVVRAGLRALITATPDMELIGEAADGREAVLQARSLQPDVILMDLVMAGGDGIWAIGEITRESPDARILTLTAFATDDKVLPAIKAGALGYVLKDSSSQVLIDAIQRVYRGEPSLDPTIARKLLGELQQPSDLRPTDEPLTEREVEVLRLVARGLSNQQIAGALTITEQTVRAHVSNILSKLHLANRTQAALYALREGIADLDP